MKTLMGLAGLTMAGFMLLSCNTEVKEANYQIIPLPQEISVMDQAAPFILSNGTKIMYPEGNEKMQRNAEFLASYIKDLTGKSLAVQAGTDGKGIILQLGGNAKNPEGYQLKVTSDQVVISGPTEAGVFYGIQTLRKSIPVAQGVDIALPAVEINDYPRFSYRGAHLDVSRHFFPVDSVKRFIDMLALHNMNRFHWHLTDDQGWRIEIKGLPELTEVGSKRTETVIGHNSGKYDGKPYGGFFTQEEAKEIVAYAAERHITVIPEIDLPGHMQAALTAYPNLGCTGGPYEVWKIWGVSEDVLCAGNDETLKFIDDVLGEIIQIFPSEYIHVGGDECPKVRWTKCPKCQDRIKALGIKADKNHTAEEKLQSFIINHAEKFLNDHGRQIIGWDEILEGGLAPNATVMSWRGEEGGITAVTSGHRAIMTPGGYCYLDSYQDAPYSQPEAIGGYLPLKKVYSYNPVSTSLSAEQAKLVYGAQVNLFTEYVPTPEHVEYMLYPRTLALAEVAWSAPERKSWPDFHARALKAVTDLQAKGYHTFDLKSEIGSRPESLQPLTHLALGKKVIYNAPYNSSYAAQGDVTLTDGIRGDWTYGDGAWQGFISKNRLDVTVDMENETTIHSVTAAFMQVVGAEVFLPASVVISVSDDGVNFTELKHQDFVVNKEEAIKFSDVSWEGTVKGRYVRYQARAGKELGGWIFTDEIIVK